MKETKSLEKVRYNFAVINTADNNKVVAMTSHEKDAEAAISTAHFPPMNIKNKKALKIVKTKKKQMIGWPLDE